MRDLCLSLGIFGGKYDMRVGCPLVQLIVIEREDYCIIVT